VKEYIGESSITIDQVDEYDTEYPSDDITSLSCSITKDIALGDKIGFFYQLSDGSWALTGNMSSAAPYSYIPVADSYKAGETYYFDVALQLKEPEDITWYVNGTKTYEEYMTLKSGITTIKAVVEFSDGTKETITQKIKVD